MLEKERDPGPQTLIAEFRHPDTLQRMRAGPDLPIFGCIITSVIDIQEIVSAIQEKRIRITDHADEEAQTDRLTFDEIFLSVLQGEIIEDYPTDRPYPSCLIYGDNFQGEPIHSVWAYNEGTKWAVLITVYRPNPNRWINWRERRK